VSENVSGKFFEYGMKSVKVDKKTNKLEGITLNNWLLRLETADGILLK